LASRVRALEDAVRRDREVLAACQGERQRLLAMHEQTEVRLVLLTGVLVAHVSPAIFFLVGRAVSPTC